MTRQNHLDFADKRHKFVWAIAACVAAIVSACGGGESDSRSQSANAKVNSLSQTALSAKIRKVYAVSKSSTILPDNLKWGSMEKCDDSEFIKITEDTNPDAVLLSRHRHCSTLVSPPTPLYVSLMRREGSENWELYRPGAPTGTELSDFKYGIVVIETDFAAYGNSNGMSKQHDVRVRVKSFVPDVGFPIAGTDYSASFAPQITCSAKGGSTSAVCVSAPLPSTENIKLTAGKQSGWSGQSVSFNWLPSGGVYQSDYQVFEIALAATMDYSVQDTPRAYGGEPVSPLNLDSPDGRQASPQLRCDRGEAGSSLSGCVYAAAAAVWVMDTTLYPELIDHVYAAQTTIADGRADFSPGVYLPDPTARAVASVDIATAANLPLTRSEEVFAKQNRYRSCQASTSLIRIRTFHGSPSCLSSSTPGCSCDEYPMAATFEGGLFHPDITSVRFVNDLQNRRAGSDFGRFVNRDRVFSVYGAVKDDFWVFSR